VNECKPLLEGQRHFEPLAAFDAATAASLMAALLLFDLGSKSSSAQPGWSGEGAAAAHPMDVFGATAVHGGSWRCAYSVVRRRRLTLSTSR